MIISIYKEPIGTYIAIPSRHGSERRPMWGHEPVLVIRPDWKTEMSDALQTLVEKDWSRKGTLGNTFVSILTEVFQQGMRFKAKQMNDALEVKPDHAKMVQETSSR